MPDGVIGIVGIAVIIGLAILWQKGSRLLSKQANQKVFARRSHGEGQELVSQRLEFSSSAPIDEVRRAILATVKVAPSVPLAIADAYLIEATETRILYGYGNKVLPHNFRGLLRLEATNNRVQGSWEIINWTLTDGIIAGQSVMKRLIADINTALKSVDPQATLRVSSNGSRRAA